MEMLFARSQRTIFPGIWENFCSSRLSSPKPCQIPHQVVISVVYVFIFCITFSIPSFAGRYELVKGKGIEICEAYAESLNSFFPRLPMVCGRPVSSKLGFSKPQWERPKDLLTPNGVSFGTPFRDFGEYLWERDVNPVRYIRSDQWQQWKGTPEQLKEAHRHYLVNRERHWIWKPPLIAEFDIDNDGKPDHVYFERPCGSVYGDLFAVLAPDYKTVDRKKTENVMPHPPFKQMIEQLGLRLFQSAKKADGTPLPEYAGTGYLKPVGDPMGNVHYDFFFFKEKTYFDQWWRDHPSFEGRGDINAGRLRVFEAGSSGTQEICTYQFRYEG